MVDFYFSVYDKGLFLMVILMQKTRFINNHNANKLVREKTCFESKDKTSYIDLFITNWSSSMQNTMAVTKGLPDYHKMVATVLKKSFQKAKPRVVI